MKPTLKRVKCDNLKGDEFVRRLALKSSCRNQEFEKEIDKLRMVMNDQKLVLMQFDAENKFIKRSKISAKDIKTCFLILRTVLGELPAYHA